MQLFRPIIIATLWLLCHFAAKAAAFKAKFTNIECVCYDKTYCTFKHCYLKAVTRDKVALYIYLQLHQLPLTEIIINAAFYQKGNGYRPFMYNTTTDFCEFRQHLNRFMFWKILYLAGVHNTNLNHTCPFDHDAIVDGLTLSGDTFALIPFPSNDYQIRVKLGDSKSYKLEVRYSIKIYD